MQDVSLSRAGVWYCFTLFCGLVANAAPIEIGQPVGPFSVRDFRDKDLSVTASRERKGLVVVFLSARSAAVDAVIDAINVLHGSHRNEDVVYMGVCSNAVESADELGTYARNRGMIFTIYRDPKAVLAGKLGVTEIPSVAVIDSAGLLVHRGGVETKVGLRGLDIAVRQLVRPHSESQPIKPTPITTPGEKGVEAERYMSLSFSSELIFERIPEAAVYHCSTITQAANGDLLCLWYGGSYESADDQTLYLARRRPHDRVWQKPQALIAGPTPLPGNGVIFTDSRGHVQIAWCRMESERPIGRGRGWDNCRLMLRVSQDHGVSWGPDVELLDAALRAVPRNPPCRLSNGNFVLPLEAIVDGVEGSIFLIGSNDGAQWHRGGFTSGGSQPAVIERTDKSLYALMRKAPRLTQVESRDGGESWSTAKNSLLRNPDAGITMTRLTNGHLIVVFNDSDTERTPLSIARSLDEGQTWETPVHLESNRGEYSYPCIIESADRKLHITYTYRRYAIKHVEINEEWLFQFERPD